MNNELTLEQVQQQNEFLKIKLNNTLQTLANQQDYALDLETELHIAHETLRALNKQEEQAQG